MDALTHCIEAYLAKDYHPICDGIALEGLRLAAQALPRCVEAPGDIEARSDMMMASMMGAIAFQKGLGLVHSCAHALSTVADLHHGFANGVMIDRALRFNLESSAGEVRAHGPGRGPRGPDAAKASCAGCASSRRASASPPASRPRAWTARSWTACSKLAFQDSCHQNNPRPVQEQDFRRIYSESLA